MWTVSIAFLAVATCLWLLWRRKKFSLFKEMGIPGPEPSIFFGNMWELSERGPLVCHKEWVEKYGKVVGYYFGSKPIVLVADTELLKKIQLTDFQKFINRPPIFATGNQKPIRGDGFSESLTNLKDRKWKDIRSILTPSFTTSKMRQMAPIINNAIDALVENVDAKAESGESFDIYKMYQGLTMDVIGRTAFGIQTDCQRNPNDPFLRTSRIIFSGDISSMLTVIAFSFPELGRFWTYIRRFRLMFKNKGKNPIKELTDAVSGVIKTRRGDKSNRRPDLLQLMIDAEISESDLKNVTGEDLTAGDDNTEEKVKNETTNGAAVKPVARLLRHMNDYEILDNSVLFFLAGYETTSTALGFTTHLLIHHQDIQDKIRKEVNELISREGKLDYTSVQKLQYLDQVLSESLRMYPPIYLFVNRETGEDVEYGNLRLKKGFPVQVPVHVLHHDPDLWPEPEKFDPERFSPENKSRNNSMAFQAFGAGPRNCVGMRFAQMEAKLALARILHKYKLVACDETDKDPITLRISAAVISPGKGVHLKAVPC